MIAAQLRSLQPTTCQTTLKLSDECMSHFILQRLQIPYLGYAAYELPRPQEIQLETQAEKIPQLVYEGMAPPMANTPNLEMT